MNRSRYTPRPRASIGSPFLSNSRIFARSDKRRATLRAKKESVRVLVVASAYVAEGVNTPWSDKMGLGVDEVFDELRSGALAAQRAR